MHNDSISIVRQKTDEQRDRGRVGSEADVRGPLVLSDRGAPLGFRPGDGPRRTVGCARPLGPPPRCSPAGPAPEPRPQPPPAPLRKRERRPRTGSVGWAGSRARARARPRHGWPGPLELGRERVWGCCLLGGARGRPLSSTSDWSRPPTASTAPLPNLEVGNPLRKEIPHHPHPRNLPRTRGPLERGAVAAGRGSLPSSPSPPHRSHSRVKAETGRESDVMGACGGGGECGWGRNLRRQGLRPTLTPGSLGFPILR